MRVFICISWVKSREYDHLFTARAALSSIKLLKQQREPTLMLDHPWYSLLPALFWFWDLHIKSRFNFVYLSLFWDGFRCHVFCLWSAVLWTCVGNCWCAWETSLDPFTVQQDTWTSECHLFKMVAVQKRDTGNYTFTKKDQIYQAHERNKNKSWTDKCDHGEARSTVRMRRNGMQLSPWSPV